VFEEWPLSKEEFAIVAAKEQGRDGFVVCTNENCNLTCMSSQQLRRAISTPGRAGGRRIKTIFYAICVTTMLWSGRLGDLRKNAERPRKNTMNS
jgi:hypothetical protein